MQSIIATHDISIITAGYKAVYTAFDAALVDTFDATIEATIVATLVTAKYASYEHPEPSTGLLMGSRQRL